MKIRTDIDPTSILRARGLGDSDETRKFLAQTVANLCDPYVPSAPGSQAHMRTRVEVAPDGATITYPGPYAHFQYIGEVMVGENTRSPWARSGERKTYAGREIQYSGGPMRGKKWDKRMLADHKDEIVEAVAKRVGGRSK